MEGREEGKMGRSTSEKTEAVKLRRIVAYSGLRDPSASNKSLRKSLPEPEAQANRRFIELNLVGNERERERKRKGGREREREKEREKGGLTTRFREMYFDANVTRPGKKCPPGRTKRRTVLDEKRKRAKWRRELNVSREKKENTRRDNKRNCDMEKEKKASKSERNKKERIKTGERERERERETERRGERGRKRE